MDELLSWAALLTVSLCGFFLGRFQRWADLSLYEYAQEEVEIWKKLHRDAHMRAHNLLMSGVDPPNVEWDPRNTPHNVCWHCQCCLEPNDPSYCTSCMPFGDCDDPDCEEPGCKGIAPRSAGTDSV